MKTEEKSFLNSLSNLFQVIFERFKNKDIYGALFAISAFAVFLFFISLTYNFLKKDTVSIEVFCSIILFYILMVIGLIVVEYIESKKQLVFYEMSFLNTEYLNQYKDILIQLLHSVRDTILSELAENVKDQNNIRANIFLPQNYGLDGAIYKLVRPEVLKIPKFKPYQDDNIFFQPNEGLTGEVFESGLPRYTKNKDYNLQNRVDVNKDLKWILSWPLQTTHGTVLGVINIDCLKDDISDEILNALIHREDIIDFIHNSCDKLDAFNKIHIALCKKNS